MSRSGPVTKDTSTVQLGLAQIRVIESAANIDDDTLASVSSDSIGALANTKYMGEAEFFDLESGFPQSTDAQYPLRENASIECAFKEMTPYNYALAHGIDPTGGTYDEEHSGEIKLGARVAPAYVRMEAVFTYPNGTQYMYIIFPRAQVTSSMEADSQLEEAAAIPITFKATPADSDVSGGDATWNDKPLGRIYWA